MPIMSLTRRLLRWYHSKNSWIATQIDDLTFRRGILPSSQRFSRENSPNAQSLTTMCNMKIRGCLSIFQPLCQRQSLVAETSSTTTTTILCSFIEDMASSNTDQLFDGKPGQLENEEKMKTITPTSVDPFGALPDAVLQHLLSFLPSRQAVQTCVLARRWRHLWMSLTSLRINDLGDFLSAEHLRRFVHHLLALRDETVPIYECELDSYDGEEVAWWYQYAIKCKCRVLRVAIRHTPYYVGLYKMAVISEHLERLELEGVEMEGFSLDFSSCPTLEILTLYRCRINVKKIVSLSLRRLSIDRCSFHRSFRTHISVPNLVFLGLADFIGWTPLLESMPSLATTFVRLSEGCEDYCFHNFYGDCHDAYCNFSRYASYDVHGYDSVLLDGLSNTSCLELITAAEVFIVRKDLVMRPSFSKLKRLLLNISSMDADFRILAYFLKYAPILEKLTLQQREKPTIISQTDGMNSSINQKEQLFVVSKHLKVVEVRYYHDEVLQQILNLLSTYDVAPEKITMKQTNPSSSKSFSFQQKIE